jgi:hypothetical protein
MSQPEVKEILYTVLKHLCVGEPIKISSKIFLYILHCTENPSYVLQEMKLRGLIPNSYIHVSVSNLYIPRIGLPIWPHQNRQTDPGNIEIVHRYMNVESGARIL